MNNKEITQSFLEYVVDGKIEEAYQHFVSPEMRHHNAWYPGDADSLQKAMKENHQEYPDKLMEVQDVIAEGDLVTVHSWIRTHPEDPGIAHAHIFRVENSRIVEMWDIGQKVPENSPNEYGMF